MKNNNDMSLVIAGGVDSGMDDYRKRLSDVAQKYGVDNRIVWKGRLTLDEMAEIYRFCSLFIMTSRAEACPNIALEAMAHGCLVVSGIKQPMVEFFQDSALYYANGDAIQLAAKMNTALGMSEQQRSVFVTRARRRAKQFSWQLTADKTVRELENAVGK
jgi:glycosyltransferase involved in cell wall biosynthesis